MYNNALIYRVALSLTEPRRAARSLAAMFLSSFLVACSTPYSQPTDKAIDKIDEVLNEEVKHAGQNTKPVQPPAAVSSALLPDVNLNVPGNDGTPAEVRFDVSVSNAPAKQFFMSLVEGTTYNMVLHPEVAGEITLNLKNVSIPEVMEVVRNVYGYEYSLTGSSFQVLPVRIQTRIFQVDYLNLIRKGVSQTRVTSGQVTQTPRNSSNGSSGGSGGSGGSSQVVSPEDESFAGSNVKTKTESDFWHELTDALNTIIGHTDRRNVVASPQTGVIVVRAMPIELRDVENFLKSIQGSVDRQVILEAKIIEVELNDGFQSGINWAALGKPGKNKSILGGQTGGGSVFLPNGGTTPTGIAGNAGVLDPGNLTQVVGTATSAFGGVFSLALNLNDFTAFIELLETQGNVQVLSSPRVSTVNNQKAIIKVGTDEFFVTDISTTNTSSTTTSTTSPDVTLTPFFSGIALDVTPQINDDGDVVLHIHPTVSEITAQTKTIGLSTTTTLQVPLAVSAIRESDSIVRAKSGQLIVIGGLMQNTTREDTGSVPLLGDIPFFGSLFRQTRQSAKKSELVIMLKPIVVNPGTWGKQINQSAGTFKSMRQGFHYGGKSEVFGTEGEKFKR